MLRIAVVQRPPVLLDTARCGSARRSLDVAAHYARPDLFELHVNRRPRQPVAFD